MIRARGEDTDAIVHRQIVVRRIQFRLVITWLLHRRLPVVWHDQPGTPSKELERAHMRADPIPQAARPSGAGERVTAGTQHRHNLTGVIDEHLFSSTMVLAQDQIQPRRPLSVEFAEATVAITVRMLLFVLLPEELQGHMGTL